MKAVRVGKTQVLSTLRLLFMGDNSLTVELEEQLWELTINGFPQAIIDCRYTSENAEYLYNSLSKQREKFAEIKNIDTMSGRFNFWLIKVSIKYIEKLTSNNGIADFISLCESSKGYFAGVSKDCIDIMKKIVDPLKPERDLILSFAKTLKQLAENSTRTSDLSDPITALAIALRIGIKIEALKQVHKPDSSYTIDDKLNCHNEMLTI